MKRFAMILLAVFALGMFAEMADAGGFRRGGRFRGFRGRNRGRVVIINNGGFRGGYGGGFNQGFCGSGGGGYGFGGGFGGGYGGQGFSCPIGAQFGFNQFVANRAFFNNRLGVNFVNQVFDARGFAGSRFVRDRFGRLFNVSQFGARRIQ